MTLIPAALRAAQADGIYLTQADFQVFRPQGRHIALMGVKFGTEEGAKFHRHRCNDKSVGPQKLNFFLLRFDQNVEYKRPPGAYPLHDFHKISRVCTPFQVALDVKFGWICSRGYGVMGLLT